MRIAILFCLALAFAVPTTARAQTAPTSPCAICCLACIYCCVGVPTNTASLEGILAYLGVINSDVVTAESPAPPTADLQAMAF